MNTIDTIPNGDFSCLVFDKDGTITPANLPMQPHMVAAFCPLLQMFDISILTARDFETCKQQIIEPLQQCENLHMLTLACSNGSEIYQYISKNWTRVLTQSGNIFKQQDAIKQASQILSDFFRIPVPFLQKSQTAGVFPCLPLDASSEECKQFDPTKSKRKQAIALIDPLFSKEYAIIPGGTRSIDISLGTKKTGLQHLLSIKPHMSLENTLYFGDNFDGGNDAPLLEYASLHCIEVKNENDTLHIIKTLYNR